MTAGSLKFRGKEGAPHFPAIYVGPYNNAYSNKTVLAVENGDFWMQGVVRENGVDRSCRFYASDIIARGLLELRSHVRFNENAHESTFPHLWTYSSNGTIPTANRRLVYVQGNTGGDNPCKLETSGAVDGQVITIVNTSTNHRINVTGTAKGNHWILEGCCGTFRYLSGYGLWYPERFSW